MSERHREHEQDRRKVWANAYLMAIEKQMVATAVANATLAAYDAKFPNPIEGEQYLQQEAQDK